MRVTSALLLAIAICGTGFAKESFQIDSKGSKVNWAATKLGGAHNGTINVKKGSFLFEGEDLKAGEFVVDMTTIKVLDLTDPKYNKDLTDHLKSDDFFSVAKHGDAKFIVKTAKKKEDGTWEVSGPLTIKNISNEVTVPLKIEKKGATVTASGKTKVDRTKWDIKYRSGKFFPQIGDKLIHDDFEIDVAFKANKK